MKATGFIYLYKKEIEHVLGFSGVSAYLSFTKLNFKGNQNSLVLAQTNNFSFAKYATKLLVVEC